MKHFLATTFAALTLATSAGAMTFSLPSLTFPATETVVSTQNCPVAQDTAGICR